jgi:ubiquinone/menaquinone biosynthesis C-methylase UbiE
LHTQFNHIAFSYDAGFTYTPVGRAQRNLVWQNLENCLTKYTNPCILELNCGTGEDARWLAAYSNKIVCTDASEKMIKIAAEKNKMYTNIEFQVASIQNLPLEVTQRKYDIIFSNFGGFNCLAPNEITLTINNLAQLLAKNGKIVLVIMPKTCLWEIFYFVLKGKLSAAFRRNTKHPLMVQLTNDIAINTWYHNTALFKSYRITTKKPVGFFIPPSYLNSFMQKNKPLFKLLVWLENSVKKCSLLSNFSDHYYLELIPKF